MSINNVLSFCGNLYDNIRDIKKRTWVSVHECVCSDNSGRVVHIFQDNVPLHSTESENSASRHKLETGQPCFRSGTQSDSNSPSHPLRHNWLERDESLFQRSRDKSKSLLGIWNWINIKLTGYLCGSKRALWPTGSCSMIIFTPCATLYLYRSLVILW